MTSGLDGHLFYSQFRLWLWRWEHIYDCPRLSMDDEGRGRSGDNMKTRHERHRSIMNMRPTTTAFFRRFGLLCLLWTSVIWNNSFDSLAYRSPTLFPLCQISNSNKTTPEAITIMPSNVIFLDIRLYYGYNLQPCQHIVSAFRDFHGISQALLKVCVLHITSLLITTLHLPLSFPLCEYATDIDRYSPKCCSSSVLADQVDVDTTTLF